MLRACPLVLMLPFAAILVLGGPSLVRADGDPLADEVQTLELASAWMELGLAKSNVIKVRAALSKLRSLEAALAKRKADPGGLSAAAQGRVKRMADEVADRVRACSSFLDYSGEPGDVDVGPDGEGPAARSGGQGASGDGEDSSDAGTLAEPEIEIPQRAEGELASKWIRRIERAYAATEDGVARTALASALATEGGVLALPALFRYFERESDVVAREGIHAALVIVGTTRVARRMASYAARRQAERWEQALDVTYRCLSKPEAVEPERPHLRTIRAFHRLKERPLTLSILGRLDEMGYEGIAALGEVIFVPDFGYHDHTVQLLGTKRDGRAVPALVHKMNRFKFDHRVQMPAHHALMRLGWYAVPELVARLDDKAAGIWISWTLRKISGETMGTDKRKWHDWWKSERLRHPELFEDPAERPAPVTTK